jgi:hypothetical protein
MSTTKDRLIESATCTAVFAIVFGLMVSCGGGAPLKTITGRPNATSIARIVSHLAPTTAALPPSGTQAPMIAALFQTSQQASQIQQSFQGLSCDAFQFPGAKLNLSGATTGFIPMQVLADPYIIHPKRNPIGEFDYYSIC